LLREYFIAVTIVEMPIRGDIRQYVAYAWNMLHHGTFSHVWPGTGDPLPDNFRGPGYPAFLAGAMWLDARGWYQLALHAQAVLGALTATMTVLLARHWLPVAWAFVAGGLVAVWPHHIAATGALLTEVAFGFLLVSSLLLAAEASRRRSTAWAAACGVAFSAAALTSMVSLAFPLFAGLVFLRSRMPRAAALVVVLSLLGPAAWAIRDAGVATPEGPGRMTMNVVQGSWPQYHRAYASRNASPIARDIMREIDREERLLAANPRAGLGKIASRMSLDAGYFAYWYLLEKPFLLWDWDIRMGAGDVYFHVLRQSPLETNPTLHFAKRVLELLNPAVFLLSALASLVLVFGGLRKPGRFAPAAVLVAGFCVYVTAVHVVFQAEPRYSIPYRPMQMLMLATALAFLVRAMHRRRAP